MLNFSPRTEEWLLSRLDFNPAIARRDIRARSRRANPWVVAFIYLAALFGLGCLPLLIGDTPSLSREGFMGFVYGQTLLLVALMTGAAGSVSARERDKGTEDAIRMTSLTSRDYVIGALIGLLDQHLVLMAASVPFAMWAVVLGEVSVLQVFGCLALTLALLAAVGALALTNQTNIGTITATVAAYVGVVFCYQLASAVVVLFLRAHPASSSVGTWSALFLILLAWIGFGSVAVSITDWVLARRSGTRSVAEHSPFRRGVITCVLLALLGVLLSCVPWVASATRDELAALSPPAAVQRVLGARSPLFWSLGDTAALWSTQLRAWAISMTSLLLLTHVLCRIAVAAHKKRNRREVETVNNPRG